MAKLVVLSEGMTGQSYELKVDKTTIGRVDDNTFPIPHASVSSHHCEVLLRGSDVVVKDLNSTNGTFIQNQQITGESVLKPGQILRLGQVDIRLEAPGASASTKKAPIDSTMVISKGVSLEQLEQGPQSFDTTKGVFTKKTNKANKYIFIGATVLLLVIVVAIFVAYNSLSNHPSH
ncbi:MAG TPA: FHA domain-containing protein [Verrucomicrobiae bacterium]|jgi:pSer/pThr/pTyr-binding forkhead associated (FHA) protein|nr:FHA domain-containing protein [Verrucomicrobiae bacterium]